MRGLRLIRLLMFVCLFLQDDFAQNREFITLVVYKTDGKKVYYPGEDLWVFFFPCHSGVRFLSFCVLKQLTLLLTSMASALTARIIWPRWGWPAPEHTPSPWWFPSTRSRTPSTTRYGSVTRYSWKSASPIIFWSVVKSFPVVFKW